MKFLGGGGQVSMSFQRAVVIISTQEEQDKQIWIEASLFIVWIFLCPFSVDVYVVSRESSLLTNPNH